MSIYRVSEGEVEPISTPADAVIDGLYDQSNWGTGWTLVKARNKGEALRCAVAYDGAINTGSRTPGRYLRPLSHATLLRKVRSAPATAVVETEDDLEQARRTR